jgi:predicted lipoprotein with Yx(FWY)xxD motif
LEIFDGGNGLGGGYRRLHGRAIFGAALAVLALAILPRAAGAVVYSYPPATSPAVKTAEGFELPGTVYNYYSAATTWHFEYGTSTAYGTSIPIPDGSLAADAPVASPVSETVTGLQPNMTYHYRLVASNSAEGTVYSEDKTFSTAEGGGAPPTTGGGGGAGLYPGESGGGGGGGGGTVTGKGPQTVVKEVKSKGRKLLATNGGHTLYSLSVETHGNFVCTKSSGCRSLWHPLTVAAGVVPKGPVKLGTVHRPDGGIQVTFRGRPLYTFAGDKKQGQTKGDGIKDVGVWHAVLAPRRH